MISLFLRPKRPFVPIAIARRVNTGYASSGKVFDDDLNEGNAFEYTKESFAKESLRQKLNQLKNRIDKEHHVTEVPIYDFSRLMNDYRFVKNHEEEHIGTFMRLSEEDKLKFTEGLCGHFDLEFALAHACKMPWPIMVRKPGWDIVQHMKAFDVNPHPAVHALVPQDRLRGVGTSLQVFYTALFAKQSDDWVTFFIPRVRAYCNDETYIKTNPLNEGFFDQPIVSRRLLRSFFRAQKHQLKKIKLSQTYTAEKHGFTLDDVKESRSNPQSSDPLTLYDLTLFGAQIDPSEKFTLTYEDMTLGPDHYDYEMPDVESDAAFASAMDAKSTRTYPEFDPVPRIPQDTDDNEATTLSCWVAVEVLEELRRTKDMKIAVIMDGANWLDVKSGFFHPDTLRPLPVDRLWLGAALQRFTQNPPVNGVSIMGTTAVVPRKVSTHWVRNATRHIVERYTPLEFHNCLNMWRETGFCSSPHIHKDGWNDEILALSGGRAAEVTKAVAPY